MKAIVINPTELPKVVEIKGDYESLTGLLDGGYLEMVRFTEASHAYIDEDGKAKLLPMNLIATKLMKDLGPGLFPGDVISGPMVILGSFDDSGELDGEEHDVPQDVIDKVMAFRLP